MAQTEDSSSAAKPPVDNSAAEEAKAPQKAKKFRHSKKDFDFEGTLGDGAFSKVVIGKVINEESPFCNSKYAVKIMDKRHIVKNDKIKYVNIEKQVFIKTKAHPFICHMHFGFQDSYSLYLALDLCSDETLSYLIYKYIKLDEKLTIVYMSEIVSVLEFMHSRGIYHRDMKPENVLIHDDGHIRVTDFGTCKIIDKKSEEASGAGDGNSSLEAKKKLKEEIERARRQSFIGTALYVPPEMLSSDKNVDNNSDDNDDAKLSGINESNSVDNDSNILDESAYYAGMDFWALGCMIYQCLLGVAPFAADNEYLIFKKIESLNYELPNDNSLSSNARDIIVKFLNPKLSERLGIDNIDNIKNHAFFNSDSRVGQHEWDYEKMKQLQIPKLPQTPKDSPVHLVRDSDASTDTVQLLNNKNDNNSNYGANGTSEPAMIMAGNDGATNENVTDDYVLMNDNAKKQESNGCCCVVL